MEELIPSLKVMLNETIEIKPDPLKLVIIMTVKNKIDGVIASPDEIITMLKMYGNLSESLSMQIEIDNKAQQIILMFQNEDEFKKVEKIFETLWDNAIDMLIQATKGDFSRIKNIPDIEE